MGACGGRKDSHLNAPPTQHHEETKNAMRSQLQNLPGTEWTGSFTFVILSFIICKKVPRPGFYFRVLLHAPNAEMEERYLPNTSTTEGEGTTSNISPATIALLLATGAQKIMRKYNLHCAYSFVPKYFGLLPQCSILQQPYKFLLSSPSTCHLCCGQF